MHRFHADLLETNTELNRLTENRWLEISVMLLIHVFFITNRLATHAEQPFHNADHACISPFNLPDGMVDLGAQTFSNPIGDLADPHITFITIITT